MKKRCVDTFLFLALLQTGLADSRITVSYSKVGENLSITCCTSLNNTVVQINWEIRSQNQTNRPVKLGTYHPDHGIHIEDNKNVTILGNASSGSSTLSLKGGTVDEDNQICCIFNTFPAGVLTQCTVKTELAKAHEAEAFHAESKRPMGQWVLLVGGCSIFLLSITLCLYYSGKFCCELCCGRRRVFEVETYLTDQHTDSEGTTDEPPHQPPLPLPPDPQPQGFDPSKLYAKIKLDLLYGRLWKAYQGASRAWSPSMQQEPQQQRSKQGEPPEPPKVYFLLGEHRASQNKEPVLELEPSPDTQPQNKAEPQPSKGEVEEPVPESDPLPLQTSLPRKQTESDT
ncbi:hypothetical protein UPYG_G00235860 [Umbra pygmaea]|uniref:Ig-like domain-containing protein n=1 Tax=Umbra pygmaea TaxID=75934 RepID=A0ABD0WEF5_UMBPY